MWQSEPLSAELETAVLAAFPDVLTRADHVARMDRRIGAKDFGAAMRAAKHAGDDHVAIVKACTAAEAKAGKGGVAARWGPRRRSRGSGLRVVPGALAAAQRFAWLQRSRRIVTPKDDVAAAAKLVLAASPEDLQRQDTDEWWRERRALARKLLDIGDATTAYQVARDAAPPANPYYRADTPFHGWLDCAALPRRSGDRAHAFRPYR